MKTYPKLFTEAVCVGINQVEVSRQVQLCVHHHQRNLELLWQKYTKQERKLGAYKVQRLVSLAQPKPIRLQLQEWYMSINKLQLSHEQGLTRKAAVLIPHANVIYFCLLVTIFKKNRRPTQHLDIRECDKILLRSSVN